MDEKLKKEIKEKYFHAKYIIREIENSDPEMQWTPSILKDYEKELEEIDNFFNKLA